MSPRGKNQLKSSSPYQLSRTEWIIWGLLALFCFLVFQHGDLRNGSVSSLAYLKGHFYDFYEYNNTVVKQETFHLPPKYLVLAFWLWPLRQMGLVTDAAGVESWLLYQKFWLTVLFAVCAWLLTLIHREVDASSNANSRRELLTYWLTHPIVFFVQFMYGGYDVIYFTFFLAGMLFLLRQQLLRAAIFVGIAASFKNIALLAFLPMLFVVEKRPFHILGLLVYAYLPQALIQIFYRGSGMFKNDVLGWDHITRIFGAAIYLSPTADPFGKLTSISLFFFAFTLICVFYYFFPTEKKERSPKVIGAGLTLLTTFFILVFWHPHWLIVITPLWAFKAVESKNRSFLHLLDLVLAFVIFAYAAWTWIYTPDIFLKWGVLKNYAGAFWPQGRVPFLFPSPIRANQFHTTTLFYSMFCGLIVAYLVISLRSLQKYLPEWPGAEWDGLNYWIFRFRLLLPIGYLAIVLLFTYL